MYVKLNSYLNENTAYHGSPNDFNYFSSNMIGSGEGASGWGYGFYFSENINDAKDYAKKLEKEKGEGKLYKVRIPNKKTFFNLNLYFNEQSDYVKNCMNKISNEMKIKLLDYSNSFDFIKFKNEIDDNIVHYPFKINDAEYNDYLYNDILYSEFINGFGNYFYQYLTQMLDGEYYASEFLHSLGISGNLHNSFGHTHYIVFDEDDIEILKKTKPKF